MGSADDARLPSVLAAQGAAPHCPGDGRGLIVAIEPP